MPSRRNALATSGGVLTTVLAGCLGLGEPDGAPVRFEDSAVEHPSGDDVEVLARERWNRESQGGTFSGEGTVYERPDRGLLILVSEYRVLSDADGDWKHIAFSEVHDWSNSGVSDQVRSHGSNVVSAGNERATGRRRDLSATDTGRWEIELDSPIRSSQNYRFRTTVGEAAGATLGDTIAVTRSDAAFGGDGTFDDSGAELSTQQTYTYGDTGR